MSTNHPKLQIALHVTSVKEELRAVLGAAIGLALYPVLGVGGLIVAIVVTTLGADAIREFVLIPMRIHLENKPPRPVVGTAPETIAAVYPQPALVVVPDEPDPEPDPPSDPAALLEFLEDKFRLPAAEPPEPEVDSDDEDDEDDDDPSGLPLAA